MGLTLTYDESDDETTSPPRSETEAVLPEAGDNFAIARTPLARGQEVTVDGRAVALRLACPEGFRFAITRVRKGDACLSWGLPFGDALTDIDIGEVLVNEGTLAALAGRGLDLPSKPNFADRLDAFDASRPALVSPPVR